MIRNYNLNTRKNSQRPKPPAGGLAPAHNGLCHVVAHVINRFAMPFLIGDFLKLISAAVFGVVATQWY